MSKSVKILLVVLGVCAMGVVLVCGGVFLWVGNNKDRIATMGDRAFRDADAFAADHEASACADATLARYRRDPSLVNQVEAKVYLMRCLEVARKPADFCATIPATTDFLRAAMWCQTECARRGSAGDQVCPRLMQTVVEYCERRGSAPAEAALPDSVDTPAQP